MREAGRHRRNDTERFGVLFVCTGNLCRSPLAEILTRCLLVEALGEPAAAAFTISSAGTHAVLDAPMHPASRRELAPWGGDADRLASAFRSRPLRPALLADVDLVIGLTATHRAAVLEQVPAGLPVTFTLRELARAATAVDAWPAEPVLRARALVELARRRRGRTTAEFDDSDEIVDPVSGGQTDHHRALLQIDRAVGLIVDLVGARCAPPHPRHYLTPSGAFSNRSTTGAA